VYPIVEPIEKGSEPSDWYKKSGKENGTTNFKRRGRLVLIVGAANVKPIM